MRVSICLLLLFKVCCIQTFAQGNASLINDADTNYRPTSTIIKYSIGERTIPVEILQFGQPNGLVCINVHDNEDASVKAAEAVLTKTGGTLIKFDNKRQRNIKFTLNKQTYEFDPNRIFSQEGIMQTLQDNKKVTPRVVSEIEAFARNTLCLLPDSISCIVALHNNSEGAFSINSYLAGGSREKDAKTVYSNELEDADDIVLTTDSLLYAGMVKAGYNSILQDNLNARKDGSLSIHFGELGKRYINIETQAGKTEQYKAMFMKLLEVLKPENNRQNTETKL